MKINQNLSTSAVNMQKTQKTQEKDQSTEPKDGFQQSTGTEEKLGYGGNLLRSTLRGAVKGFCIVGNAVDKILPDYDGLDHFGMHILTDGSAALTGLLIGTPVGAVVGFAYGLFGGTVDSPANMD